MQFAQKLQEQIASRCEALRAAMEKACEDTYKAYVPSPWVEHAQRHLVAAEAFGKFLKDAGEGVAALPEGAKNTANDHHKACLLSTVRLKSVLDQAGRACTTASQSRGGRRSQEVNQIFVSPEGVAAKQQVPSKAPGQSTVASEPARGLGATEAIQAPHRRCQGGWRRGPMRPGGADHRGGAPRGGRPVSRRGRSGHASPVEPLWPPA
jgi:hypothetical protein